MDWQRRCLLQLVGATGVGALAGCIGNESEPETDPDSSMPTPSDTPQPQQYSKLTPDDGDRDDTFGGSVAVSSDGTTALIDALGDEDPNGEYAGSAYVFKL